MSDECDELRDLARELLDAEEAYRQAATLGQHVPFVQGSTAPRGGAGGGGRAVSGLLVAAAAVVVAVVVVLGAAVWGMNRLDERAERDQAEPRTPEPPILGGAPRHLRRGSGRR